MPSRKSDQRRSDVTTSRFAPVEDASEKPVEPESSTAPLAAEPSKATMLQPQDMRDREKEKEKDKSQTDKDAVTIEVSSLLGRET